MCRSPRLRPDPIECQIASETNLQRVPSSIRTVVLVVCLAAAFITTHIPLSSISLPSSGDKYLHFLGFTALGGAAYWSFNNRAGPRSTVFMFVGLVLYGAIDELTQPPFGRDCEFFDWLLDCGGGALGLALGRLVFRAHP
jgi:VanZ family protein